MEAKELKQLIAFHQSGLDQYRQHISPAAQSLEQMTIEALKELLFYKESITKEQVQESRRIIEKYKGVIL